MLPMCCNWLTMRKTNNVESYNRTAAYTTTCLCWYKQLTEAYAQIHKSGQQEHTDSPPRLLSEVQVKSSDPSSDNLEFVVTQHLRKVVLVTFYQKKCLLVKQVDLRDMFKKASVSVCTSTAVAPSDPVTYYINLFSHKDSTKHRRGP